MKKVCNKCGIEKDESHFNKRSECDSLRSCCRGCENLRRQIAYKENLERERERKRLYRKNLKLNPIKYRKFRDAKNNCLKRIRSKNPEKYRAQARIRMSNHRLHNPEAVRKLRRQNFKKHVDNLSDSYVIHAIRKVFNIKHATLHQHPDLIKSYRQQIKNKRLLKTKKHGKSKEISEAN